MTVRELAQSLQQVSDEYQDKQVVISQRVEAMPRTYYRHVPVRELIALPGEDVVRLIP